MCIRSTKPVANDSSHTFFAAVNIKKFIQIHFPSHFQSHSNQRYFLEHSEEPYNKYRYLHLIPNLQLTSAGRTGTANGPQIALGPHFAQVWSTASVPKLRERKASKNQAQPTQGQKLTVP